MRIRCYGRRIRKGTSGNKKMVKIEDFTMLVGKERWAEYFEGLFNVEEDREDEIVALGSKNSVKVLGGLKEEVQRAVRRYEVERKAKNRMVGLCEKSVE